MCTSFEPLDAYILCRSGRSVKTDFVCLTRPYRTIPASWPFWAGLNVSVFRYCNKACQFWRADVCADFLIRERMAQHYLLSSEVRDCSLIEIMGLSEEEAFWKLVEIRWGNRTEQVCPECGVVDSHYYRRTRKQWRCKHCDHTFSLTSGTPLADRKLSFQKILLGLYLFVPAAKGIPACELSRKLNVQVKTAWLFLHKLREPLLKFRDTSKLSGIVHIDGGHFGGKPRKARVRKRMKKKSVSQKIKGNGKDRVKKSAHDVRNWIKRKENRRVVMVIREVSPEPGIGATKTRVALARSENERDAVALANRYIAPGSVVHSDENPAYNTFSKLYDHNVVAHSREYATKDGITNNQAESFFSRFRRSEQATTHGMLPQYMLDYANEMAWREDFRRKSEKTKLLDLTSKLFCNGPSIWWRGYHQGFRRNDDLLMY